MFYKFRCAVARFMYGRNGMDQMNQALLRGYLVILVAQLILSLCGYGSPPESANPSFGC